jgi:hypothetical protein
MHIAMAMCQISALAMRPAKPIRTVLTSVWSPKARQPKPVRVLLSRAPKGHAHSHGDVPNKRIGDAAGEADPHGLNFRSVT